jgi:hypothetical protein
MKELMILIEKPGVLHKAINVEEMKESERYILYVFNCTCTELIVS